MKIPLQIEPSPIMISTVEIRYSSEKISSNIFPLVYKQFMDELPSFEQNKIPKELRNSDPRLKYITDYTLSNEDYKLSFSDCVLSFENVGEYKLWPNYFPFIQRSIPKFFNAIGNFNVERIGVRYGNVFDKAQNLSEVANLDIKLSMDGYNEKFDYYRTILSVDNISLLVQLFNNATVVKENFSKSGVCIDIDTFNTESTNNINTITGLIDNLHGEGKKCFYRLLNPAFLETLNPKY